MSSSLLDIVQEDLRDPRLTGQWDVLESEHRYLVDAARDSALIDEAFSYFSRPDVIASLPEAQDPDVRCIVGSGHVVMGFGRGMLEAVELARLRNGKDALSGCAVLFINTPPSI